MQGGYALWQLLSYPWSQWGCISWLIHPLIVKPYCFLTLAVPFPRWSCALPERSPSDRAWLVFVRRVWWFSCGWSWSWGRVRVWGWSWATLPLRSRQRPSRPARMGHTVNQWGSWWSSWAAVNPWSPTPKPASCCDIDTASIRNGIWASRIGAIHDRWCSDASSLCNSRIPIETLRTCPGWPSKVEFCFSPIWTPSGWCDRCWGIAGCPWALRRSGLIPWWAIGRDWPVLSNPAHQSWVSGWTSRRFAHPCCPSRPAAAIPDWPYSVRVPPSQRGIGCWGSYASWTPSSRSLWCCPWPPRTQCLRCGYRTLTILKLSCRNSLLVHRRFQTWLSWFITLFAVSTFVDFGSCWGGLLLARGTLLWVSVGLLLAWGSSSRWNRGPNPTIGLIWRLWA